MYPFVDKSGGGMKRRVDEYGETLDVGMWLRRGRVLDEDAESEEVKEAKRKKREEEEAKVNALEASPTKRALYNGRLLSLLIESSTGTTVQICHGGSQSAFGLPADVRRPRRSE